MMETFVAFIQPALPVLGAIGTACIRSVAGWAENAFKPNSDGGEKITAFELKQLASTTMRVGLLTLATYYGLGSMMDLNIVSAGATAMILDFILGAIKKK